MIEVRITVGRTFVLIDVIKRLWIRCPKNHESISDRGNKFILYFVERASLYNLVNKTNLLHTFS